MHIPSILHVHVQATIQQQCINTIGHSNISICTYTQQKKTASNYPRHSKMRGAFIGRCSSGTAMATCERKASHLGILFVHVLGQCPHEYYDRLSDNVCLSRVGCRVQAVLTVFHQLCCQPITMTTDGCLGSCHESCQNFCVGI